MVADQLAQAVRHQLGLGRLLPLGDAADGAWLAERAAVTTLRTTASQAVPNVRLGSLRFSTAAPDDTGPPPVPAPPSALPPGPLRLEADFAATAAVPLTTAGELLRNACMRAAGQQLGLRVAEVDLRVTDLLDSADDVAIDSTHGGDDDGAAAGTMPEHPPAPADCPHATATAEAVIAVPGVTRLAPLLGSAPGGLPADAVRVIERRGPRRGRHMQIQLAVAEDTRPLDVARAVRQAAVKAAAWDAPESTAPLTVAVLVNAIDPAIDSGGQRTEPVEPSEREPEQAR
jgi:hypothetical protein